MECFSGGGGVKALWRHIWGGLTFCDDVWRRGEGVKNREKSRDVIYGRPLIALFIIWQTHDVNIK